MQIQPDLQHHPIRNTALPYVTNESIISDRPAFRSGSNNLLTSVRGYSERAPGWAYNDSTTFTGTVKRLFVWEKWNGDKFIMACEVTGSESKVYKRKIGTDAGFVLIYNDTGSTTPFDFCVSNDMVFFSNGNEAWKYDGTTVHPWGIGMGAGNFASASVNGVDTLDAQNGGYIYVFAYGNSTTGHVSSPSLESTATGNFTNQKVTVTCQRTTDTQVDRLHLFRSTDGGGGVYFECENSPYAHTPGAGTMDVDDTTADADLDSLTRAPVRGVNDYPDGLKGCVWWQNRIWAFKDNKVYYSGWEEIKNGVQEECFPASNFHPYPSAVKAIAAVEDYLLVFMVDEIWRVSGDSLDTFSRKGRFKRKGVRNQNCVTSNGKTIAWLDPSNKVLITDGVAYQEVSLAIRQDFDGISHDDASVSFHDSSTFNWLCVHDGGNSKLYILDLDTQKWMPPWTRNGGPVHSGEQSDGQYDLLIANSSNRVCKLTPASYTDEAAAAYTAIAITNLFPLLNEPKPDELGVIEHVMLERNNRDINGIAVMVDDDPEQGSWTAITAQVKDPPYRTQGSYLFQKWYDHRTGPGQRAAIKIDWAAANSKFILYTLDLAHKIVPP